MQFVGLTDQPQVWLLVMFANNNQLIESQAKWLQRNSIRISNCVNKELLDELLAGLKSCRNQSMYSYGYKKFFIKFLISFWFYFYLEKMYYICLLYKPNTSISCKV